MGWQAVDLAISRSALRFNDITLYAPGNRAERKALAFRFGSSLNSWQGTFLFVGNTAVIRRLPRRLGPIYNKSRFRMNRVADSG